MPNNPFADFANALGGALYGDPRQYQLGQFYGQRATNQNLKNQQLQTEIAEHDALVKGLAEDPDMLNAVLSGEGFSAAKFNLGKEQRAGAGETRLVEGLDAIAKKDPYLASQYKVGRTGSDIRQEANIPGDLAAEARLVEEDTRFTDALTKLEQSPNAKERELAAQLKLKLSGPDIRALSRIPLDEAESGAKVAGQKAETLKTKIETQGLRKEDRRKAKKFDQDTRDTNQKMIQRRKKNDKELLKLDQEIGTATSNSLLKSLELKKQQLLAKNNELEAKVNELKFKKEKKDYELQLKTLEKKDVEDFFTAKNIKRKDFSATVEAEMKRIAGTVPGDFASSGLPAAKILLKNGKMGSGSDLSLSQVRQLAVYDVLQNMGINPLTDLSAKQRKAFGIDKFDRNAIELIEEPTEPKSPDVIDKAKDLVNKLGGSSKKEETNDLTGALGKGALNQPQANAIKNASEDQLWDALDKAQSNNNSALAEAIMQELNNRGATDRIINAPILP